MPLPAAVTELASGLGDSPGLRCVPARVSQLQPLHSSFGSSHTLWSSVIAVRNPWARRKPPPGGTQQTLTTKSDPKHAFPPTKGALSSQAELEANILPTLCPSDPPIAGLLH